MKRLVAVLLFCAVAVQGTSGCAVEPSSGAMGAQEDLSEAPADIAGILGIPPLGLLYRWVYVPFDGRRLHDGTVLGPTYCMNGSPAGLAFNLSQASSSLLIFLEGGGACWDETSCAHVGRPDGIDSTELLESLARTSENGGILDRGLAQSPVRDWSFVYVPYCSGDFHGGTGTVGREDRVHFGHANMAAFLELLVETFADADQVLLTGSSAGGIGALFNFEQTRTAFGPDRVYHVNDAAPVLPSEHLSRCLEQQWRDTFGLDDMLPEDCDGCRDHLFNLIPHLLDQDPRPRLGLTSGTRDLVIRWFYSWGQTDCTGPGRWWTFDLAGGLDDVRSELAEYDNFRTFYVDTWLHTFLGYGGRDLGFQTTSPDGVVLSDWVGCLLQETDCTWEHEGP
ncbi:MAG: hypothetical protein HYY06_09655 [Deltaproteobacteria bacterium]|nr:hypothetical protein [Deltaproteobacteria bacterium]